MTTKIKPFIEHYLFSWLSVILVAIYAILYTRAAIVKPCTVLLLSQTSYCNPPDDLFGAWTPTPTTLGLGIDVLLLVGIVVGLWTVGCLVSLPYKLLRKHRQAALLVNESGTATGSAKETNASAVTAPLPIQKRNRSVLWIAIVVAACAVVALLALNDRWLLGWYVRHDILWTAPSPTPAHTFTHPDYGFTMTVPANMEMSFKQYKTSNPPYDAMWMSYPHKPCPPNAYCWWPGINISIWKVDQPKAFIDILISKGIDRDAVLDTSRYSNRDGWTFYTVQAIPGMGSRIFAYSIRDSILVEINNHSLDAETKLIVDSLRLPAQPTKTFSPNTVTSLSEVKIYGVVVENNTKYLPVDGGAHLLVREDSGNIVNVTYLPGEAECKNSALGETILQIKQGSVVEVFGKMSSPGFISTCESTTYYIKQTMSQALILSLSVGNSITGTTYRVHINEDGLLDYSEHPHLQEKPAATLHRLLTAAELDVVKRLVIEQRLWDIASSKEVVPDGGMYDLVLTQGDKIKRLTCLMPLPDRSDSVCTQSLTKLVNAINIIMGTTIQ